MALDTTSPRRPSDAEWAAQLPRIYELYYELRYTLHDTQHILQQETGFSASLRMYKDRLRNISIPPKKICMQKYQAMGLIADEYQRQGLNVYFVGPSGCQMFKKTPAQIFKQLRRPNALQTITLEQAENTLRRSNIHAIVGQLDIRLAPLARLWDAADTRPSDLNGIQSYPIFGRQPSISSSELISTLTQTRMGFNTSMTDPFLAASQQYCTQSPSMMQYDIRNHNIWNYSPQSPKSYQPVQASPSPSSSCSSLINAQLFSERGQNLFMSIANHDPSDFSADFEALFLSDPRVPEATVMSTFASSRALPAPSPLQSRQLVIQCAAPFLLHCLYRPDSPDNLAWSEDVAMAKFKHILTSAPQHGDILPLLSWLTIVLTSNDMISQLKRFISECCQVLDTFHDHGFPLSTPFRYLLAFCKDDRELMQSCGSQFAGGTDQLSRMYGREHPAVLVNEYFHAWHEMTQPSGWAHARSILERCKPRSEAGAGRQSFTSINCLTMMGIGCVEDGLHDQACAIFEDVLGRMGSPPWPLQPYKLLILQRLATQEERLGNLMLAEAHYREVYEGRLQILPTFSPQTKAAVCSLAHLLRRLGRADEAVYVERRYSDALNARGRAGAVSDCAVQSCPLTFSAPDFPFLSHNGTSAS